MVCNNSKLKSRARALRSNMTEAEKLIWSRIRGKQIGNVQFYRQRPIATFIADFYAPSVKLVLEIDGAQHLEKEHFAQDKFRDTYLNSLAIVVLRFDNIQVIHQLNGVIETIFGVIQDFKKDGCHKI